MPSLQPQYYENELQRKPKPTRRNKSRSRIGGFEVRENPKNFYEKSIEQSDRQAQLEQQVQMLQESAMRSEMESGKQQTYQSFDKYLEDNNLGHLNDLIQTNPMIKKIWSGDRDLVRLSKIDEFQQARVKQAVSQARLGAEQAESAEDNYMPDFDTQAFAQQYVEGIHADGTTSLINLRELMVASGYYGQMTEQQQASFRNWANFFNTQKQAVTGQDISDQNLLQEQQQTTQEGLQTARDIMTTQATPEKLRQESDIREETIRGTSNKADKAGFDADMSGERAEQYSEELRLKRDKLIAEIEAKQGIAAAKNVQTILEGLDSRDFLNKDPEDFTAEDKAAIIKLKKENPYDTTLKKFFTETAGLSPLLEQAVEIKAADTGLIDKYRKSMENFVKQEGSDNLDSTTARSQFLNVLRHSFFGAALTEHELTAFREAYGDDREQLIPNLQKLKTALLSIKGKYDLAKDQNEYVFHAEHGKSAGKIDEYINRIEDRIGIFNLLDKNREMTEEEAIRQWESQKQGSQETTDVVPDNQNLLDMIPSVKSPNLTTASFGT